MSSINSKYPGVFYKDSGQSFENILYYGNEWLLFIWEVILVVILDYSTTNFTFAALMAWIINEVGYWHFVLKVWFTSVSI